MLCIIIKLVIQQLNFHVHPGADPQIFEKGVEKIFF